jgi:methylthioribose-1-phosphate isomerase
MRTITFKDGIVRFIDQRLLPQKLSYIKCRSGKEVERAIKAMAIRGAPLLGAAGAYAIALEASRAHTKEELFSLITNAAEIRHARPTAKNLSWAIERMKRIAEKNKDKSKEELKKIIVGEANRIAEEDIRINTKISRNGAQLIKGKSGILTHCNAGGLACVEVGTALGVIEEAFRQGKVEMVYATETRPLLQGARLTAFELKEKKIPVTLIVDDACGFLMQKKKVGYVIVGADRVARNGDTANKIGTYTIACLTHMHRIPFYVASPLSTFDLSAESARDIVVEERAASEILNCGKKRVAPHVSCWNPAFDITPARYITAFITEKGILNPRKIAQTI